jgi:hypothetical protein
MPFWDIARVYSVVVENTSHQSWSWWRKTNDSDIVTTPTTAARTTTEDYDFRQ